MKGLKLLFFKIIYVVITIRKTVYVIDTRKSYSYISGNQFTDNNQANHFYREI